MSNYPKIVLEFHSQEQLNAFIEQVSDGAMEELCEITPKLEDDRPQFFQVPVYRVLMFQDATEEAVEWAELDNE